MEDQVKAGIKALVKVVNTKKDVLDAFVRKDIGTVSLFYGNPGDPKKGFKKGNGVSHIIAKRDWEAKQFPEKKLKGGLKTAMKLVDVIVNGEITKTVKAKETIHISKDGYEAVLSLDWHGNKVTWLLTGYWIME